MFKFLSRSKRRSNKEDTSLLSSRLENSPTVIYEYGTRQASNRNMHGYDSIEDEEDDNLQYDDVEEEEGDDEVGEEYEDDIDVDAPILPIFSSAYLGEMALKLLRMKTSRLANDKAQYV